MAKIKRDPKDFKVVEVLKKPLREKGTYKVYRLYKVGLETQEAINIIAKISKISPKVISYGGLKDKNAETLQFLSIPGKFKLREISKENLKLSFVGYLQESITPSLVKGNFFEIVVRGGKLKEDRIKILEEVGIPNYYGEQRFTPVRNGEFFAKYISKKDLKGAILYLFTPAGWEGSKIKKGKKLFIEGKFEAASKFFTGWRKKVCFFLSKNPRGFKEAFKLIPKSEIEFQMNVLQSYLFNEWLKKLIEERTKNFLSFKYKLGFMLFPLERVELPRELPVFHPESSNSFYEEKLKELGIEIEGLLKFRGLFHRFRRETFVFPKEFKVENLTEGIRLKFFLPSGSYATNVVRFLYDAV
ncbi:MAG: tRNA pseudouridine(13) synthase TruD [Desulfurobacteriaceae bacterium]